MSARRDSIVERILSERAKQFDMPGSEWDATNTPNDWIAIAATYLTNGSNRKHTKPAVEDFETDMIKAAAVILAALENISSMRESGTLR